MKLADTAVLWSLLLAGIALLLSPVLGGFVVLVSGAFLCMAGSSGIYTTRRLAEQREAESVKISCPQCGHRNRLGPSFCDRCDARLVA